LGGSLDTKLLEVRVFDTKVKRIAYIKQKQAAEGEGTSNSPLCAMGHEANKSRLYELEEMDADHVSAWSKGGKSSARMGASSNLCKRRSVLSLVDLTDLSRNFLLFRR
jgi:hypothetical protein